MLRKLLLFTFCLVGISLSVSATHNRAGEITYRWIQGLEYEITITTYTDPNSSQADRCELVLDYGYGPIDTVPRVNGCLSSGPCKCMGVVIVSGKVKKNIYRTRHTFPGPSTYVLSIEDPNRNDGIDNIPSSVNVPFALTSKIIMNPDVGMSSSPTLEFEPIDNGCVGIPYYHNPGAIDPDGDSLSYELATSLGANGQPISGYSLPNSPNAQLYIDANTGTLHWLSPHKTAQVNVCFRIIEWRKNSRGVYVKVGEMLRDMQIDIAPCDNEPPIIYANDFCVNAGDSIRDTIIAVDSTFATTSITAIGQPFLLQNNPATFTISTQNTDSIVTTGITRWTTSCDDIRSSPYKIDYKANDNKSLGVALSSFKSSFITVVGPAATNLSATPIQAKINLNWNIGSCANVIGYDVYRKIDSSSFIPQQCETGIPSNLGFQRIAEKITTTSYVDTSSSLVHGQVYCYRVVSLYPGNAEGYTSTEVCAELKKDVPIINGVSVIETEQSNGVVDISWNHPVELDTNQYPGPYKYEVIHKEGFAGASAVVYTSNSAARFYELDTIIRDSALNTESSPHNYKVRIYSQNAVVGVSHSASSVFLNVSPSDKSLYLSWQEDVPWENEKYVVLREINGIFDPIDTVVGQNFLDTGLTNDVEYRYYITSIGKYSTDGLPYPLLNNSQITSGIPKDTIPPCPPLNPLITSICNENEEALYDEVTISWDMPSATDSCYFDIVGYNIFYSPQLGEPYEKLRAISSRDITETTITGDGSIAGCYAITAIDSFNNESGYGYRMCVDNCPNYRLPNVFTPGGDGINDYFHALYPFKYISRIEMFIYNRWGNEVYRTEDPYFRWSGLNQKTNDPCPDGTYFYVCNVYEARLTGEQSRVLKGHITLINQSDYRKPSE